MPFIDLATCTAEERDAIERLAAAEIIKGVGEGQYNPDGLVSRRHMALYLDRIMRWEELASDEHLDSSVLFFTTAMSGGSGWWRAPRVIGTNQHVPLNIYSDGNGHTTIEYRDFLVLANGALLRWDVYPASPTYQKQFPVVWDRIDKRDIAYIVVPEELWLPYLDKREKAGLPREPRYINPADSRPPRLGEKVMTCGSPLVRYEFAIDSGIISMLGIDRGTDSDPIIYALTSAAINPGNSGGICLGTDRAFLGIPNFKPFYGNPLSGGWIPADNLGEILTAQEIVKWERRAGVQVDLRAYGITL